jgi:endonuclease-8
MPEVIELRKYADFLKLNLKNKYINEINILNGRYKKHKPFELYSQIRKQLPIKVLDVKTKGKFLYFIFEGGIYLFSTLGLSGGWTFLPKLSDKYQFPLESNYIKTDLINSYKKRSLNHLNVEFVTDNGSIYFYDTLSFGTLKGINDEKQLNKKLESIGPDIMEKETTFEIFKENITKIKQLDKPIGNVLMNQKLISGIGNYLRADILWLSKISPFRLLKNLSENELKDIYNSVKLLTWADYDYNKGIKLGYIKNEDKVPRDYGRNFFVYNQVEDIYGNLVIREELYEGSQKRTIHWVKKVQK